ncbi:hypothetical protein MMC34_001560 [Xylographa carneopallida]|nr:hypothetical protein [Xylographa carneopallida]
METSEDKQWASNYLLDPLTAPAPSEETGPGTHYGSTFAPNTSKKSSSRIADEKKNASVNVREAGYPSPPASVSPRQAQFPHRQQASNGQDAGPARRDSLQRPSTEIPTSSAASTLAGRTRGASLTSRFPGDESHRPLDILKREKKIADRAPHLRKKHFVGSDSIDQLDSVGGKYHHDGPFDATLLARNTSFLTSPVEAVSGTNEEALRATPREKVVDSIERHRPLDGVAITPPGIADSTGRTLHYQEGADLMIEEGNFRRWPGVKYLPEDLKGKGEPSYSIEKALKEHKKHRRVVSNGNSEIEMTSRPQSSDGNQRPVSNGQSYGEWENDMRRSNTTGKKPGNRLTRRIGSQRKGRVDE